MRRNCSTDADLAVFNAFLTFNRSVLKTNLYRPDKTALSFRLDPSFLPTSDYPDKPYAVFFVVGSGMVSKRAINRAKACTLRILQKKMVVFFMYVCMYI